MSFAERCARAQQMMQEQGVDWLFVCPSPDLRYLNGYSRRQTERLTLFMLARSGEAVMVMPEFESRKLEREPHERFYRVRTWREECDPVSVVAQEVDGRGDTIAVSEQLWSVFFLQLQQKIQANYIPATSILTPLRLQKDESELECFSMLGRRMDAVFEDVCSVSFAGRKEVEVARDVFSIVNDHGLNPTRCGGVASGPNSASPHHQSGDRVIRTGDSIWIELGQGGNYQGYAADKTRVVHVGEPSSDYRSAYAALQHAQKKAREYARPGISCEKLDRFTRGLLREEGYGDHFITRTGHGVGLDIHEPPWIVEGNSMVIRPGMVFTIEPGIYISGAYGMRIEDVMVVTETGAWSIYSSTRDLVLVE